MRQQFKIWHLFLATTIVALVVFWSFPPEVFPYEDLNDAQRIDRYNCELRETFGDVEGPFKWKGSSALNSLNAPNRKIRYIIDDSEEVYVVPKHLDGLELRANFFENRKRNTLVLLYSNAPD